jgi:CBS domain-containing protein
MASVRDILEKKGTRVLCIAKDETVLRAAQVMNEHKIGALVVLEEGRVAGIFTERDVLRRVVGEERAPATTRVEEVMTAEVACCSMQTPIEEARAAMKNRRIRHLPVIDREDRLCGLVSIGDLNAFESANQEETIFWMNEYLYGRGGTR